MNATEVTDRIFEVLLIGGDAAYFGEPVSQLEHAVQTAARAEAAHAGDALIAAALLHDIGHLLHGHDEDIARQRIDARHEDAGERWLATHFDASVTGPIRLHVGAKRLICRTDASYVRLLSPASQQSLALQGGPMSAEEAAAFVRLPWAGDAIALRRWDDSAKIPGLTVPSLERYRPLLERLVRRR